MFSSVRHPSRPHNGHDLVSVSAVMWALHAIEPACADVLFLAVLALQSRPMLSLDCRQRGFMARFGMGLRAMQAVQPDEWLCNVVVGAGVAFILFGMGLVRGLRFRTGFRIAFIRVHGFWPSAHPACGRVVRIVCNGFTGWAGSRWFMTGSRFAGLCESRFPAYGRACSAGHFV